MRAQVVTFLVCAAALLCGCVQREVLIPKSAAVPAGVDLSGSWRLVDESGAGMQGLGRGAGLIHVFLEAGTRLKLTQTADGLFISFDRSIVEEYRFGEQRVVSVGPVQADRVSGWAGESYVIETLGPDNHKLVETWQLEDDGSSLVRQVALFSKGSLVRTTVQTFEPA